MTLTGRLVAAADVTAAERQAMFLLMDRHYAGVSHDAFEADLAEKHWVVQVHDPAGGELCGFSTQMLLAADVNGRPVRALFSGDTIIARERWGDNALARVWGRLALRLIDTVGGELYWFLISKGYKTYRFLPVFFHEFYPRHDVPTPAGARAVLDALGRHKFAQRYDRAAGIVRAGSGQCRLRGGVAEITAARLRDPHVAFFTRRNPGHAQGDELCCLAPLTRVNFTPAAYRVIGAETHASRDAEPLLVRSR
jgi:hypothetical protein